MDCYTNNFPALPRLKKLAADKHVITELPLVPFVIINLTSLTAGVCMKVRFRSKVTRGFSFSPLRNSHSPLRGSLTRGKFKKNLWDQGSLSYSASVIIVKRQEQLLLLLLCGTQLLFGARFLLLALIFSVFVISWMDIPSSKEAFTPDRCNSFFLAARF